MATPIVLVRIREQEIAEYGHPIPDAVLASAVARLLANDVAALGIDLYRVPPASGEPPKAGVNSPARPPIRAWRSSRSCRIRDVPAPAPDFARALADLYLETPGAGWALLDFDQVVPIAQRGYEASREPISAWWNAARRSG